MEYDYWVSAQEIIPPLGENRYAGVAAIYKIGEGQITHGIGETWGKTKEEAEAKMTQKVKEWLENKK